MNHDEDGALANCSETCLHMLADNNLLNPCCCCTEEKILNSGKQCSKSYDLEKDKSKETNSRVYYQSNNVERPYSRAKEEKSSQTKQRTPRRSRREYPSGDFDTTQDIDRKKKCEFYRSPSLIDRRMEFIANDREISEDNHKKFPFTQTPSGHFKVLPDQVVFDSKKVSVLVADPNNTKVNIHEDIDSKKSLNMPLITDKLFLRPQVSFTQLPIPTKVPENYSSAKPSPRFEPGEMYKFRIPEEETEIEEDEVGDGLQYLKPEIKLENLGFSITAPIDYTKISLPPKTNLYHELYRRISNYINTDVKVIIGQEEFSCHFMVLQSYSEYFEKELGTHRIELPIKEVSVNAFVIIYDWMITGKDCVTLLRRENILEVFMAAKFLIIRELEEQCWTFLDSEEVFSEDSAFMLYLEAKKLDLQAIKELMVPRIRKFFLMLVSSQDFIDLDVDEVCLLLNSNYISVNCEMEVLMSAVRWLKGDWNNRVQYLHQVMSCVRFGLIAPWQLVDIKRNPENPELLELTSIPEITKMVDDGLSFVIIKYWYGHQSEDYTHWIDLLGLKEPQERNWAGKEKNYYTYRQFLAYLDEYRRDNLFEKNKLKSKQKVEVRPAQACYPPADLVSPVGSEYIKGQNLRPTSTKIQPAEKERDASTDLSEVGTSTRSVMSEDEAASTIQAAFRKYKQRKTQKNPKASKQLSELNQLLNPTHIVSNSIKYPKKSLSQNFKVLSMFAPTKNLPSPQQCQQHQILSEQALPRSMTNGKFLIEGSLFSNDRETVLVFGGLDPHTKCDFNRNNARDIYRYVPETNCWEYIGEIPEPRQHHCTAFFKGRIYVVGGTTVVKENEKYKGVVVNTVWSFDPISRNWTRENPMITPRKNFALVVSHMKLYAIGGQDKNNRILASVERFEVGGKWEDVAPLKVPRMGMACAKYRDCIWVAGGMCASKRNPLTDVVECYDPKSNEWTRGERLRFPRCFATLFAMNDELYLIGGAGRSTDKSKNTLSIGAVDVYNLKEKEWKMKTELAIPRHGHSVAYLGTQIMIIGGVTTLYMRALSNIECYCCERFTWVRGISPLPCSLSGHSSVSLPPASFL